MQLDLFDVMYERFTFDKDKPIRVVELFSGIGFQSMGMDLAEIPYEVVAISEIDKFAILAYASIHTDYLKIRDDYDFQLSKEEMVEALQRKNVDVRPSTNIERVKDYWLADKLSHNLGDISLLKGDDFPKDIDVMTYSFPCTDLSKAGQQAGLGKGTRSGLVYEVLRILQELKEIDNLPKMPIMENVVDLVQAKFVKQWQEIQQDIEKLGYVNYQQTLNAKEYGIAQNRRRVFMVSILGEYNYNFPKPIELKYRLKDYLENNVDESYYLSDKMMNYLNSDHPKHKRKHKFKKNQKPTNYKGVANTITTRETSVVDSTFIKVPEATKQGYALAKDGDRVYLNRAYQKRGVVQEGMIQTLKTSGNDVGVVTNAKKELCNKLIEQGLVEEMDMIRHSYTNNRMEDLSRKENENNMSATLTTRPDTLGVAVNENGLRIRKLTLRETGRLMGMNDEQINKQGKVTSNAQMYKQHGNGIVAQVIGLIIGMAYYDDEIELREKVMNNSHMWIKKNDVNMVHGNDGIEPKTLNPKVNGKQPSLQDRIYDSDYVSVAVTPSFHPSYTVGEKNIKKEK